jgi:hypothetical protein
VGVRHKPNQQTSNPIFTMPQLRVYLGLTNAPDHSVEELAGAVIKGLTGNPAYHSPPSA